MAKMTTLARFPSNSSISILFNGIRSLSTSPPSITDDSYQYLERSIVPTMHFQKSLPRLPVPKLEKTMERYLDAMKPIMSADQYDRAKKLAKDFFEGGRAKELHESLVEEDKKHKDRSYITDPWFDMYLKARTPIPINYNPFMAWTPDPNPKYNDQLTRATNLIISACRFKRSLDAGVLSPEVYHLNPAKSDTQMFRRVSKMLPPSVSWYGSYLFFKAFPLDMSQYPSLFNSTRIPVVGKDQLRRAPNGRHVLVLRKGHLFAVDVLNADGSIKSPKDIQSNISHILSIPLETTKNGIGVLTTLDRDRWAELRSQLIQEGNEPSLSMIDKALFVVCLDDDVKTGTDPVKISQNLLHSDGINRWYDKSFSIIVQGDGLSAINFEHSWGDGVAVLRLMEDIHKDSCKNHWVGPDSKPESNGKGVQKLEFKHSPALQTAIKEASNKFQSWTNKLQYGTLEYTKMNRDYVKKQKLSPDALMQAAIQVAYYRQYHKWAPTYESCSTAAFKKGRTETVRSATSETKKFTDALLNKKNRSSPAELRELLTECSKKHSDLVKDAAMGQGFDRHLFAMKYLAESRGGKVPEFFKDDVYQYANQYVLSTSTLSTDTVLIGGFGPVVPDGFGIGYNVGEKKFGCIVSAYSDARDAKEFVKCLEQSLDDIHEILEKSSGGGKK